MNLIILKYNNRKILDYFKGITLFLIALVVVCGSGNILVIAAILSLVVCYIDKNRFSNLKNPYFNKTILLLFLYILIMLLESYLISNDIGVKYSLRTFEKISSFLLIYIFLGHVKNFWIISIIGVGCGLFINDIVVFSNYLASNNERVESLFGHPNKTGSIMAFIFPFYIYTIDEFKKDKLLLIFSACVIIGIIFCLYVSDSRGSYMAFIAEIICIISLYLYRKKVLKFNIKFFLLIILLIVISIMVYILLNQRPYDYERVLLWTAAWEMFLDNPVTGVGISKFNDVYREGYISILAKEPYLSNPHNLYLDLLSSTGIIGFCSYFALLIWQCKICLKSSNLIEKNSNSIFSISDMFFISIIGLLIHNLVDVTSTLRDYMLIYYFMWSLCCWKFKTCINQK